MCLLREGFCPREGVLSGVAKDPAFLRDFYRAKPQAEVGPWWGKMGTHKVAMRWNETGQPIRLRVRKPESAAIRVCPSFVL